MHQLHHKVRTKQLSHQTKCAVTNHRSLTHPNIFAVIENQGFSKDVCRSMVAMLDIDQSGKLGLEEFKRLLADIANWKAVFKLYDRDSSGKLSAFELREALNSAGYKLNNRILNALAHRYSSRDGLVAFDDFIMCSVKIKTMMGELCILFFFFFFICHVIYVISKSFYRSILYIIRIIC